MIAGTGYEVEFRGGLDGAPRWLPVAFLLAVPMVGGDIGVVALVLVDGRFTATTGKVRRCESGAT